MSHAQICPVCDGTGKTRNPDYNPNLTYPGEEIVTCHGCGGAGWVTVRDG